MAMRLILATAVVLIAAGAGLGLWFSQQADRPDTARPDTAAPRLAVDLPAPPATDPGGEDGVTTPSAGPPATPERREVPEPGPESAPDAAPPDAAATGPDRDDPPAVDDARGPIAPSPAGPAEAVATADTEAGRSLEDAEEAPGPDIAAQQDGPAAAEESAVDDVVAMAGAVAPQFDAARVGADRNVVLAGSGAPDTVIRLRRDGDVIDETVADAAGDWVSVPAVALQPGSYALTVESVDPTDGTVTAGSEQLIIQVARPGEADGNLAVLVDDDAVTPSVPLQVPAPVAPAPVAPSTDAQATAPGQQDGAAADAGPVDLAAAPPADAEPPPTVTSRLAVDVIDYDQTGAMVVSGRGAPATEVRLYLDNTLVGRARVDDDGSFRVRPDTAVSPGRYDLRVDQVDVAGTVASRVALPFERAAVADLVRGARQIIIQPGDYLWEIARRTYGTGFRFVVIYQANRDRIRDPDLIYPGQVFSLPSLEAITGGDPG